VAAANFTVVPKTGSRAFHGVVNLNAVWEKATIDTTAIKL